MNKRTTSLRIQVMVMANATLALTSFGQWLNDIPTGTQSLTNPTDGVTIGITSGTPPSALTVRGDDMTTPTGEVFRTDAPNGSTTNWWLLRGGTPRGRLFSLSTNNHFHLDASSGDPAYAGQAMPF